MAPFFFSVEADAPTFPAALRHLPTPPAALWARGRLPATGERMVAIVGSRAVSQSACGVAQRIAAEAVAAGYAVVSGGALGIDAAAHRGALLVGGVTFAVLGCGIDVVYPDRHASLFDQIAEMGGLFTEYRPGTEPRPGQFPARNRIVAALADATVVVDARLPSGALITAQLARRQGRRVFAVAGSPGCDQLLARGAASELAEGELAGLLAGAAPKPRPVPEALAPLVSVLAAGAAAPIDLALRLGIPLPALLATLAEAELLGWARRLPGGKFEVLRAN